MALAYFTAGPGYLQTNTGASSAYETLGMSQDGIRIGIERLHSPIKSDAAGESPADFQFMGSQARITAELTAWDKAVLAKLQAKADASATDGQAGAIGAILGVGGFDFSLYLPSSTADPWVFAACKLEGAQEVNVGTKQSILRITFMAFRKVGPTSTNVSGTALYTRVAPA